MKKILCLFLVLILFLLCSCSYDDAGGDYDEAFIRQGVNLVPNIEKDVSLYFLSDDSNWLAAETRSLSLEQTEKDEVQIVNELLKGPTSDNLRAFDERFKLDDIELLSNLANIYLEYNGSYSDKTAFSLALALTNTIVDFSSVTYVCVFINGKALSYDGKPVGALTKNQNDISDEISKQLQRASNNIYYTPLYFLDSSGTYIVPEVRQIEFANNDYASGIIAELAKGPQERYTYKNSVFSFLKTLTPTGVKNIYDGSSAVVLDFNINPETKGNLAVSAICYSVCGFDPAAHSLMYTVAGKNTDNMNYKKKYFADDVGAEMTLYFANEDGMTLKKTSKTVPQSEIGLPEYVVEELIEGTENAGNENVYDVFPAGITTSDVNYVYIANDIVVVNWYSSILDKIKDLSLNKERLLVYSVVNSLTDLKGITKVQFLVDGERTAEFASNIDIRDPLLRNVGLVI